MYESLTKYIPEISNPGEWVIDNSDEEVIHLPYVSFHSEIYGFIREAAKFIVYDYMDITKRIRKDQNVECVEEIDASNLTANDILSLITYGIQANKFCEGRLYELMKDGSVEKWLKRLAELDKISESENDCNDGTKLIAIDWSDPAPIDEVISTLGDHEIGLYYITRRYNGREKSLYLGESISSIKSRLKSHKDWVHGYSHSKIYVRIGKITCTTDVDIVDAIHHAEKALIFEHGPLGSNVLFENTVSTKSYTYTDIYRIINEGNRFELKPEVDMNNHEDV